MFGDMDVPPEWVRDVAAYVKGLAPAKLFVDGTYGVNRSHLSVEEVDLFSDHFYPVNITKLKGDLDLGEFVCPVLRTRWTGTRKRLMCQ